MTVPQVPSVSNPFRISKAVDLTDEEVAATFVQNNLVAERVSPASRMPVVMLGGKGSGRTHLMRYWSLPVQLLRAPEGLAETILRDGYVGTYVLMGGLNASRYSSVQLSDEAKRLVFGYYFDLQMASAFTRTVGRLINVGLVNAAEEAAFCNAARQLLPMDPDRKTSGIQDLMTELGDTRRRVDWEINRATVEGRSPEIDIRANPGEIFFGFPQAAADTAKDLAGITFTYLLDELENIDEQQQRYLQTLIRERREPVGMIVSGRTYGVRTYETLAAGEINRPGAEFERLRLDGLMRDDAKEFEAFCRALVQRRLDAAGLAGIDLPALFVRSDPGPMGENLDFVATDKDSPAIAALRTGLARYANADVGIADDEDANLVCLGCARPGRPLLEKALVHLIYQAWYSGSNLVDVARTFDATDSRRGQRIKRLLSHFAADFTAQVRREHRRPQEYSGFDTLVSLADGNARNFVNQMKSVVSWSEFMGADIARGDFVSIEAQQRAVVDGAEWFYGDAQVVGPSSDRVRVGMERLGELLEKLRFADKPVESSLVAFNVDLDQLDAKVREAVLAAAAWCLLIDRPPRRNRNEGRRTWTFQMNRMLAPRWDLPMGRRGVVDLSGDEVTAMFGAEERGTFERVLESRLSRVNVPFGRARRKPEDQLFD